MYEQRRQDVAVFIDFENVYVSVRDKLNANPNFEAIMDRCSDLGRVVISRAYADWYRYPRVTSALYANAIEPIYVATYYYDKDVGRTGRAIKNSVDMNLCIDAMKTLFTNTNISRFVLVTGDRDFIPLVNSIRQQGKEVFIIGIGGAASTHLAQSADEFVFYEQLVGKQTGGSATTIAIANRGTEFNRGLDPATYEAPPPREREPGREREPAHPPAPTPAPVPAEPDVHTILVEAIHLVRKRGYVSTLGSIKLVMKELMGGDFKESRYRDLSGRPFTKFKDFVVDAEKRGKVQIFTNGTVNEVFLPGEDPYKLSQFAAALTEETAIDPVLDPAVATNGRKEPAQTERANGENAPDPATTGRRRRRRSRRSQSGTSNPEELDQLTSQPELDEPDYTPPGEAAAAFADELQALHALEEPAEREALAEEQPANELAAAELPAEPEAYNAPDQAEQRFESDHVQHTWDAAWDAAEAASAPPEEAAWDAAATASAPPEDAAWDVAAAALAAAEAVQSEPEPEASQPEPEPEPEAVQPEPEPEPEASQAEPEPEPEVVQPEPEASQAEPEPEPEVVQPEPEASQAEAEDQGSANEAAADQDAAVEAIDFSNEEWTIFTVMMSGFSKPSSFQQIFDTLRGQRKEHGLNRTNEQLRTMVKQAINSGLLERSGRGKRVYYTLKAEAQPQDVVEA